MNKEDIAESKKASRNKTRPKSFKTAIYVAFWVLMCCFNSSDIAIHLVNSKRIGEKLILSGIYKGSGTEKFSHPGIMKNIEVLIIPNGKNEKGLRALAQNYVITPFTKKSPGAGESSYATIDATYLCGQNYVYLYKNQNVTGSAIKWKDARLVVRVLNAFGPSLNISTETNALSSVDEICEKTAR